MSTADKNKGWTFTFNVEGVRNPVRVVVLGEVGDTGQNRWTDEEALYYDDEDHALSIAAGAVAHEYTSDSNTISWAETDKFHPDHLLGLKHVGYGVWI